MHGGQPWSFWAEHQPNKGSFPCGSPSHFQWSEGHPLTSHSWCKKAERCKLKVCCLGLPNCLPDWNHQDAVPSPTTAAGCTSEALSDALKRARKREMRRQPRCWPFCLLFPFRAPRLAGGRAASAPSPSRGKLSPDLAPAWQMLRPSKAGGCPEVKLYWCAILWTNIYFITVERENMNQ